MTPIEQRELLELAAKAVGYDTSHHWNAHRMTLKPPVIALRVPSVSTGWDPLNNDGDSRRIAVNLGIQVTPYPIYEEPKHSVLARKCRLGREDNGIGEPETASIEWIELYGDNPAAATRLAVLRVAAEIGRSLSTTP